MFQWYFIEPSDVWFFRDAFPYAPGDSGTSHNIFPPSPQTLAGAFRSYLLAESGAGWDYTKSTTPQAQKIQKAIGDSASAGDFLMRGPYLALRTSTYTMPLVSMPADAYQKDHRRGLFNAYRPLQQSQVAANWPEKQAFCPLWPPHGIRQDEPPIDAWLDAENLARYLNGKDFSIRQDLFAEELRTTIALDYTRKQAKERMLATAPFLRLHSSKEERIGLLAQVNEVLQRQKGCLSLGGEGRAAHFEAIPDSEIEGGMFSSPQAAPSDRLKLLLLTPAWLKPGWEKLTPAEWSSLLGHTVKRFVTAALGRPLFLSGWDLTKGVKGVKDSLAFFPPGSVFYFELQTPISPNSLSDLAFTHSPSNNLFAHLGFGRVAVAAWDWQV